MIAHFIVGVVIGGIAGVAIMAALVASDENRVEEYEANEWEEW